MGTALHAGIKTAEYGVETSAVSVRKKFRTAPSVHKVMLTAFWDYLGPHMLDFMPRGSTINADRYCSTLALLRAAIKKKRRRILDVDNVIILHDNAIPHVANKTVKEISLGVSRASTIQSGSCP